MEWQRYSFYVYLGLTIVLAVLAVLIVRPFFTTVAFAAVFAYWLYPLHRRLSKYIKETPSAVFLSVLLFMVLMAIIQYGLFVFVREIIAMSKTLGTLNVFDGSVSLLGKDLLSSNTVQSLISDVASTFSSKATALLYSIPSLIISFFAFILTFFYFLKDGPRIGMWIKNNIPFPKEKRSKMLRSAKGYMDAFLKAQIVIGLLQGLICALGFFLFGLSDYILIGSLTAALLSVLPIVGPYILYVPVGVIMALQGNAASGIGLMIFGLATGSFLDYIIRPQLTGKYASMHPLAVLIGVLGGMVVFGLVGVFIGPIVLGLCVTIIEGLSKGRGRT